MMIGMELVLLGVVFVAASVPGSNFGLLAVGVLGCVAFGLAWIVLFLWQLSVHEPDTNRAETAAWLVLPLIGFLGVAVVANDIPLRVRFELSRDAFEAAAAAPLLGPADPSSVRQVGLYQVDLIDEPGVRFFLVPEGGLLNEYGFAFVTSATTDIDRDGCRHLDGPWWVCVAFSSD
jgi:hypothetical protein